MGTVNMSWRPLVRHWWVLRLKLQEASQLELRGRLRSWPPAQAITVRHRRYLLGHALPFISPQRLLCTATGSKHSLPPSSMDEWWYEEHKEEVQAVYNDGVRCSRIQNHGPPPKQRIMERGFSHRQAAIIENEIYKGLVVGYSYDIAYRKALARIHSE